MDAPTLQEILSAENAPVAVQAATFHGTSGFAIKPFDEGSNRNHWDSRDGKKISYLIMHYTAIPTYQTTQVFVRDVPDNRVSAHYVITQQEQIQEGFLKKEHVMPEADIVKFVNEENRAWHAGISCWETDQNLNAVSIGIEHVNLGFTKEGESARTLVALWI